MVGTLRFAHPTECRAFSVMPGLVPGNHVFTVSFHKKTWMAGINPAMTNSE